MLDVIKTSRVGDNNLTLIKWDDTMKLDKHDKTWYYEVQLTDDESILETEGMFPIKRDAERVYNNWMKELTTKK